MKNAFGVARRNTQFSFGTVSCFSPEQFLSKYVQNEKIEIGNMKNFEKKISLMRSKPNKLKIISDFDFTLTKKTNAAAGKTYMSTYCHLKNSKKLSHEFLTQSKFLFDTYYPIENNTEIDESTRNQCVRAWFVQNLSLLAKEKLHINDIKEMIENSIGNFYFRNGIYETMTAMEKFQIPLYVVSGGISQIIHESMALAVPNYHKLLERKLVKIVANELLFNKKTNVLSGNKNPMVYTFNKDKVLNLLYQTEFSKEDSVILLGDHFSDADITNKVNHSNCIKIGFFNKSEPESLEDKLKLELYKSKFDALVIGDGNLTLVNDILREIYL